MGFVGLVVGMAVGGGVPGGSPAVAQNPPVPPANPTPEPAAPVANVPPVDPATDHIRGNPKAKFTVIEYSDFECPFCKRHHPTLVQLLEKNDDINWVYRHYPLSFHPSAEPAALASECAAELGGNDGFWKYADIVMNDQSLTVDKLIPAAKQAGLDEAKFKECYESGKYKQKVQDQMNAGASAGVQGTPGNFILNNETKEARELSGAVPLANFESILTSMRGS